MKYIFQTPTTFDMRALSTMGLSAKPNSPDPLGIFGTGIKYGIATLLRNGFSIEILSPNLNGEIAAGPDQFRGETFNAIFFRQNYSGVTTDETALPFTTNLGLRWEPWMGLREFISNTIDEGGDIFVIEDGELFASDPFMTTFVISSPENFPSNIIAEEKIIFDEKEFPLLHTGEDYSIYMEKLAEPLDYADQPKFSPVYLNGIRISNYDDAEIFTSYDSEDNFIYPHVVNLHNEKFRDLLSDDRLVANSYEFKSRLVANIFHELDWTSDEIWNWALHQIATGKIPSSNLDEDVSPELKTQINSITDWTDLAGLKSIAIQIGILRPEILPPLPSHTSVITLAGNYIYAVSGREISVAYADYISYKEMEAEFSRSGRIVISYTSPAYALEAILNAATDHYDLPSTYWSDFYDFTLTGKLPPKPAINF